MYNLKLIQSAYIRGFYKKNNLSGLDEELITKEIIELSDEDICKLEQFGKKNELKLYYFKEKDILPRVSIVLGLLRNIYPNSLLDVGSGRGVFLFPLLNEESNINITSLEILDRRVELLNNISYGGVNNLRILNEDICKASFADNSFDVVTMLEVLEHIPNVEQAIKNACRIASKFIVVTVPSKEDNNPEHIHLLTKEKLTKMFNNAGVTNLKFSGVNGHLFLVARK